MTEPAGASADLRTLCDGLGFCDSLRWHAGELWFSDFLTRSVHSHDPRSGRQRRWFVPGQPGGIGFRPDGTPLVISSMDHLLLALGDGHATVVADLSPLSAGPSNDMLVDPRGRAYVGGFGFQASYEDPTACKPSQLLLVDGDGRCRPVADDLMFPNGMVLTPDGKLLVVAETFASRLTAFTVASDGTLSNRRLFADLGDRAPDGICLDAEGAIWVACPFAEEFIRVEDGGRVLETVAVPGRWAVDVALGGETGRELFCATARTTLADYHQGIATAAIEHLTVAVPASGEGS